jgi:riboflavin biosynthesis pyrimidine reductase
VAQPVTAILSRQGELAEKARLFTQDTNEANLLVGKVMSRALCKSRDGEPDDMVVPAMRRDLDKLIERLRAAQL